MAQVRPSMENSSANSSVWRRLAWNKKDPMPRTKRDADMKSILGASNPALPGPYMYRSARWTGQGRGELLAPGTAWMGISRYTWQLRHTIGEVRQRVDKLGHVERQGVVLFAETACSSAHSNACSGREARLTLLGWLAGSRLPRGNGHRRQNEYCGGPSLPLRARFEVDGALCWCRGRVADGNMIRSSDGIWIGLWTSRPEPSTAPQVLSLSLSASGRALIEQPSSRGQPRWQLTSVKDSRVWSCQPPADGRGGQPPSHPLHVPSGACNGSTVTGSLRVDLHRGVAGDQS